MEKEEKVSQNSKTVLKKDGDRTRTNKKGEEVKFKIQTQL